MIAIAAHAKGLVIGKGNDLPWDVPEDMRFFKKKSSEYINVLFGTNTLKSFGKYKLPDRKMCLLSSGDNSLGADLHFKNIDDVVSFSENNPLIIAGGAKVYEAFSKHITQFYITRIDLEIEGGDAFLFDYTQSFKIEEVIEQGDGYSIELWTPKQ